jgi:predicted PurR-regulated permease PerM
MNDAAERLSKYFLSQVLINSAYGVFIALGLWLIGVPSPIVWGILAMLRCVVERHRARERRMETALST